MGGFAWVAAGRPVRVGGRGYGWWSSLLACPKEKAIGSWRKKLKKCTYAQARGKELDKVFWGKAAAAAHISGKAHLKQPWVLFWRISRGHKRLCRPIGKVVLRALFLQRKGLMGEHWGVIARAG